MTTYVACARYLWMVKLYCHRWTTMDTVAVVGVVSDVSPTGREGVVEVKCSELLDPRPALSN